MSGKSVSEKLRNLEFAMVKTMMPKPVLSALQKRRRRTKTQTKTNVEKKKLDNVFKFDTNMIMILILQNTYDKLYKDFCKNLNTEKERQVCDGKAMNTAQILQMSLTEGRVIRHFRTGVAVIQK